MFLFLQSPKPKTGIFCFLIHEARPATELELPGGENVFVIKVRHVTLFGGWEGGWIEGGTLTPYPFLWLRQ